jgi:excisionase family DNA binding protein
VIVAETMDLLTVREAAALLKVNPMTVRRYIAAGKLRAVRIGRGIRISRSALDDLATPVQPPPRQRPRRKVRRLSFEDPLWDIVGSATDALPTDASRKHEYLDEAKS